MEQAQKLFLVKWSMPHCKVLEWHEILLQQLWLQGIVQLKLLLFVLTTGVFLCLSTAIQTTVNLLRLCKPPLHKEARQKRKALRQKLQAEQEELERQMRELQVANENKQKELETVRKVGAGKGPDPFLCYIIPDSTTKHLVSVVS